MLVEMRWSIDKNTSRNHKAWWSIAMKVCYMCKDIEVADGDESEDTTGFDKEAQDETPMEVDIAESDDEYDASHRRRRKIAVCVDCQNINALKRRQTMDLSGKNCIVTGARTKIRLLRGTEVARCGATVWITTRFPLLAALRYAERRDHEEWWSRLRVFGLDFRDVQEVLRWVAYVKREWQKVDVLVNNGESECFFFCLESRFGFSKVIFIGKKKNSTRDDSSSARVLPQHGRARSAVRTERAC